MIATLAYWSKGIRLYIALGSVLVTGSVVWWAHATYAGTVLYPTRIEEIFAWLATGLIVLAISIGPVYKLLPKLAGRKLLFDARRLLGISAAWFASLHIGIAYTNLFKATNPLQLPTEYKRSFLYGVVAILILLAMTFTSFDRAFKRMGIWWFRLHRLVYVAIILTILHAFIVGAHASHLLPLISITFLSLCLLGVYSYLSFIRSSPTRWQLLTLITITAIMALVISYGFLQYYQHNDGVVNA